MARLKLLSPCPPYGGAGDFAEVPDDLAETLIARADAEVAGPEHGEGWDDPAPVAPPSDTPAPAEPDASADADADGDAEEDARPRRRRAPTAD